MRKAQKRTILTAAVVSVLGGLALTLARPAFANADLSAGDSMIRETSRVRDQLAVNDPVRARLTLRLADLYFDQALAISRLPEPNDFQLQAAARHRLQAIALYREGASNASGAQKVKIDFQLARIYADSNEAERAEALWQELRVQTIVPEIQREAALRLAEAYEQSGDQKKIAGSIALFDQVLRLCSGGDSCSYAHYRKAWVFYRMGPESASLAIAEIEQALFDSKGQVRDEAVRDYLVFLASVPGKSQQEQALQKVDELSRKIGRPALISDLADGYYAAGNKSEGTAVLDFANSRAPRVESQIRLLEEYYGLREWDAFHRISADLNASLAAGQARFAANPEIATSSEKLLRRLVIQLDGERISQANYSADFKSTVDLYLALYPKSPERKKFMEGWLAAETDSNAKKTRLQTWLADTSVSPADRIQLREWLASVAQKVDDQLTLAEQMGALYKEVPAKAREYRYAQARALYSAKNLEAALPIFQELAVVQSAPDSWAIQSQNLALDIFATQKNYAAIQKQAVSWTTNSSIQAFAANDSKFASELTDLQKIQDQARFEEAAAMGESPIALDRFRQLCAERKFFEKSCENARILSVKLKNQNALIDVLTLMGPSQERALADESEASGLFTQAARLSEKFVDLKAKDLAPLYRVALMYELGGRTDERDRILKQVIANVRQARSFGSSDGEQLAMAVLKDAGLLNDAQALQLPWSESLRATLPVWKQQTLAEITALDEAQSKIGFYGNNGQRKFENRLSALRKFVSTAEKKLQIAEPAFRIEIANRLVNAYQTLAQTILSSPIPKGLPQDTVTQIKDSLTEMAHPFEEKAQAYRQILEQQRSAMLPADGAGQTDQVVLRQAAPAVPGKVDWTPLTQYLDVLRSQPDSHVALTAIRDGLRHQGHTRLAAYFEGRLRNQGTTQ